MSKGRRDRFENVPDAGDSPIFSTIEIVCVTAERFRTSKQQRRLLSLPSERNLIVASDPAQCTMALPKNFRQNNLLFIFRPSRTAFRANYTSSTR